MSYVFISTKERGDDLDFAYLEADDDLSIIAKKTLSFSSNKDEIYDILTNPDNGIFGWSIYKDCRLILDAFKKENVEPFDFQVFDVRYMLNVILGDTENYSLRKYIPLYLQNDKDNPQFENDPNLTYLALKNLLFCLSNSIDQFLDRRDFDSCFYYSLDAYYADIVEETSSDKKKLNIIKNIEEKGITHYVFFDFECANCFNGVGKICELGAIETDLDFNIIKEHHFPINPDSKFGLEDRDGIKRIHLYWEDNDYLAYKKAPKLENYYDFFKELLEDEHSLKFGHAVENDLWFLATDLKRKNLPQLNVVAADTQMMYRYLIDESFSSIALHKALVSLYGEEELEKYDHHNSLDDSKMTMAICKAMLEQSCLSIIELLKNKPSMLKTIDDTDLCVRNENTYTFPLPNRLKHIELANPEKLYSGIFALSDSDRLIKEAVYQDYDKAHMGAFDGKKVMLHRAYRKYGQKTVEIIIANLKKEGMIITNDYDQCNYLMRPEGLKMVKEIRSPKIEFKKRRHH